MIDQLHKVPRWLRLEYQVFMPEIEIIRKRENDLKRELELNPLVEHNALTREMHEIEVKVVNHLCPATASTDPQEKLRAWKWVLKQDWGEDLRPAPIHKRVYLGSSDAQRPD